MTFPFAERIKWVGAVLSAAFVATTAGTLEAEEEKWETIFDGKTLEGWDGNPKFWRVEDGAITGQTTKDNPTKGNTFIVWRKGKVGDFELELEYKIIDGNSGIQYRSFEVPNQKWVIGGYQADFEAGKTYSGILYGEKFRGILCQRGQKTMLTRKNGKFQVKKTGSVGDSDEIQAKIKSEDWNKYRIVAKGFNFQHFINGVKTAECTDNDKKQRRAQGLLALQLHAGPPMKVQFRKIRLKRLDGSKTAMTDKLLINVLDAKTFFVNNKKLTKAQLAGELKTQKPKEVTLSADQNVAFQALAGVIELCKEQGIQKVKFQTPPGTAAAKDCGADESADKEDEAAIVMSVDQKERIWIAGERTKRKKVVKRLAAQFRKTGGAELHMRAHEDLSKQSVADLLNLAHKAGIQRVTMKAFVTPEATSNQGNSKTKKVVLIAGRKSHGYGAHEHKAGCMLLAKALNNSGLPIEADVVTGGWPDDESLLNDADSIVIYCDGGGGHPFNKHLEKLDALMDQGVGMVCIHYGVEVPKGPSGNAFLDWTGGYFETNWSVNPHWVAKYDKLPDHPTARGVEPFKINDEWYYHMRFRDKMKGVTPILSDLPPKSTLKRKDGPHSGNKFVRKAVAAGESQHMAWAREREDGGRGFGFTGGHFHWNWGHDEFRQLMLNAIAWSAHVEVPKEGVPSKSPTVNDLMKNQDYPVPDNFNRQRIQKMIDEWNQ